jgi:transposase
MTRATQRFIALAAHLLLLAFMCIPAVNAQESQPQATPLPAPPPFKMIVKEERDALEQQSRDSSKRLKLTIEYAGGHLTRAEQHTARENFEAASAEIGMYHALVESALDFLSTFKRDSNKTRDLYKRLELSLRADGPRLTAMRRVTPLEYAVWIKKVEDFAREGRTEALNSFYGHTVVREPEKKEKPKESPTPEDNQP